MTSFYVINSPLVNYFFYNFTTTAGGPNLPLDGGFIFFFADEDHSVMLPTYSDVSNPSEPVVNTNPIELNAIGACPIFYLEDRSYYIVITDKNGDLDNPVWTIEHYNPSGAAGNADFSTINYIPNGQFLLHNNLPAEGEYEEGQIREAITPIAYGGFTFEVPDPTTSINKVTFERYDEWAANPPSNPVYSAKIECVEPDTGDNKKDWCIKFNSVNRFASATQQYTFGFVGIDNLGGNLPLDLVLIKNFGTGGDAEEETVLTTFNLDSVEKSFYFAFVFGTNEDKVIGSEGDDYVKLALRAPVNESSDFNIVNEQLRPGTLVNPQYPETTQRQDVSAGLGGAFPLPYEDGTDIGLYPVRTKDGWRYDDSVVGSVWKFFVEEAPDGFVPADNQTSYPYTGYSDNGIPYKRIADKWWIANLQHYISGTGKQFVTMQEVAGAGQNLTLAINEFGSFTAAANGAVSPGFTFASVHAGDNYSMTGYYSPDAVYIRMHDAGTFGAPTNGDSGFNLINYRNLPGINGFVLIQSVTTPAGLAGKYFTIDTPALAYYVWFKVDGAGSDPTPGGTGILVNLQSTYSAVEAAQHIAAALSGQQLTNILFVAGSAVPASSYWTFTCALGDFYVYYIKDGAGSDPALSGKIGIRVNISESMSAPDVANYTLSAINRAYIGMPDARGVFFRVWDNGRGLNTYVNSRFNSFGLQGGDVIGSMEIDTFLAHTHSASSETLTMFGVTGGGPRNNATAGDEEPDGSYNPNTVIGYEGYRETRPFDLSVNVFIKI
jgi:hypothetical protein